jgi:Flp pilus assembly protein TadG
MIRNWWKAGLRDERGVAAVEFALVLPLMLALYLGSVEVSRLYTADQKVATLASSVADLVAREKDTIALSKLDDYFAAATIVMQPLNTTGLGVVVSLVKIDEDGEATVVWSEPDGAGAGRNIDSPFPLDGTTNISQLARNANGYLIAAEVDYPYVPMVNYIISDTINLRHVEYFLPRFEDPIVLDRNS